MTEPGVNVQSSSEPIVIFPMRKTLPPRFGRLQSGHAGSEIKITLRAITASETRGYAGNSSPARRAVVMMEQPGVGRRPAAALTILARCGAAKHP